MIENSRQILLSNKKYNTKKLNRYEKKVYSQNGEDGIITEIFHRIGNGTNFFIEIGSGDGNENNTAFLLLQGWSGIWIESNYKSVRRIFKQYNRLIQQKRLQVIRSHVTAENISNTLINANIPNEFDLLSIDIDSNTYWVWASLPEIKPRVVVIEYNAYISPEIDWVIDYESDRVWNGTANFGASLKAYERLGKKFGYNLVGCDLVGVNAFFVRDDLCKNLFEEPFTAEHHYEPPRIHLRYKK